MGDSIYYNTGETTIKSGQTPPLDRHGVENNRSASSLQDTACCGGKTTPHGG